ncbi:putative NAD dependent epimerase/dehydratase [Aspergillus ibericus CBS 121593]|uniref:Putative NAD dependent epimerase/dehydratase n=1 Tax=Aspergillus ibericus CBS 121593 TaxID=1448316 RepID=A0A395GQF9_9EURO|nr:putative NAD dependent epimerase/dehydratase [Aspergillus ibericus CBS 121593]RAK97745.1 putative NAD dependent epimerase/dehydratase [Aspergillus ibericus CBS 121593]
MPHLFLTGGSGYIGSVLTTHALSKNYTVHSLSRTPTSDIKIRSLGAVPIRGDLGSLDILRTQAQQADIVIHLADPMSGNYALPYTERIAIDDAAVRAIADGMAGRSDTQRKTLVVTSGSLVVAATGQETDETSALWETPLNERIESERRNLGVRGRGVRVCVVRLAPWVYGGGGESGVGLFMRMFMGMGEVLVIGDGGGRTAAVHVEDAARLFLLVAERAEDGEVFNGCAEWGVTFGELGRAMAEVLGVRVGVVGVEEAVERWGFLGRFWSTENRASGGKAMRVLGWKPERVGILEDVRRGSYVELAERLKRGEA